MVDRLQIEKSQAKTSRRGEWEGNEDAQRDKRHCGNQCGAGSNRLVLLEFELCVPYVQSIADDAQARASARATLSLLVVSYLPLEVNEKGLQQNHSRPA